MRQARNFLLGVALLAVLWLGGVSKGAAQSNSLGLLAFVQNGDIWIKELPDGAPWQLTTDKQNWGPRIAPSGEWIAFRKQDAAWVMDRSGQHAQVLPGCMTDWAPTLDVLPCFGEDTAVGLRRAPNFALEPFAPDALAPTTELPDSKWVTGENTLLTVYAKQANALFWALDANTDKSRKIVETQKPADDTLRIALVPSFANVLYWDLPLGSARFRRTGSGCIRLRQSER